MVPAAQSRQHTMSPNARMTYAAAGHLLGDALHLTMMHFTMQSNPVAHLRCCASANFTLICNRGLNLQNTGAMPREGPDSSVLYESLPRAVSMGFLVNTIYGE